MTQKRTNTLKVVFLFLSFLFIITGCEKKQHAKNTEEQVNNIEERIVQCSFKEHQYYLYDDQEPLKIVTTINYSDDKDPKKYDVKFSSSNEDVITIDENGVLTVRSLGKADIYLECDNFYGNYKDTAKVTVSINYGKDFEEYLIQNFDSDGDKRISLEEALSIKSIKQISYHIFILKFRYMTNLDSCYIFDGRFGHLDFTDNPNISYIYVDSSYASPEIILPDNPKLQTYIQYDLRIPVDLSNCPNLEKLRLSGFPQDKFSLNYSRNTKLKEVYIFMRFNELDLSGCKQLQKVKINTRGEEAAVIYLSNETYQLYIDKNENINISSPAIVKIKN